MTCLENRFCIVTPNLNMGRYLPETIESVLSNLEEGDKYFVIDGGSVDDSVDIIKSYGARISGWISEPDCGYADAVVKGFNLADTKYQYWLACGDILLPGALTLARSILEQTNADMIFGDDFNIDVDGNILQLTDGYAPNLTAMMLYGAWTPLQDACFWKSCHSKHIGGLNPDFRYAADFDFFLRMSLSGKCEYTPHVFSAFRSHEGQASHKYRVAYRTEKNAAKAAVKRIADFPRDLIVSRFYYWLYVRLRARLWSKKQLESQYYGTSVHDFEAIESRGLGR